MYLVDIRIVGRKKNKQKKRVWRMPADAFFLKSDVEPYCTSLYYKTTVAGIKKRDRVLSSIRNLEKKK